MSPSKSDKVINVAQLEEIVRSVVVKAQADGVAITGIRFHIVAPYDKPTIFTNVDWFEMSI